MPSIMVFIPAFRCEKQIARVLSQFTPEIASRFAEIVVVENRSDDQTLEVARQALSRVQGVQTTLLQNDQNYNLGGSHKVAFNYCLEKGYDHLLVLHGDDQGDIQDILPSLDAGLHTQYDNLLGARFAKGSRLIGYSTFRTFGNVVFNALISLATRHKIYDMGAGLNLYRSSFLRNKFYLNFPDDLTFNVYMLYYSIWKQSPLHFFPLTWREDDQISNAKIFRQAWHILQLTQQYVFYPNKLFNETAISEVTHYSSQSISLGLEEKG